MLQATGHHPCFISGTARVQFSDYKPAILLRLSWHSFPSLQASTKMLLQNRPRSLIFFLEDIKSATKILFSVPKKFHFAQNQLHTICNTQFLSSAFTRLGQRSDSPLNYRLKTSLSLMYKHISRFLPKDDS